MSQSRDVDRLRVRWPEWLFPTFYLPSWLLSLGFHIILFLVSALFFQRAGISDGTEGTGRVVGIFVKQIPEPNQTQDSVREVTDRQAIPELTEQLPTTADLVADYLNTPELPAPILGSSPPSELLTSLQSHKTIRSSSKRSMAPAPILAAGKGETQFLGIKDSGTRFVYVVDCSGSMGKYNAINVAKAEMKASLSYLDTSRQFQVIFYSDRPFPWVHPEKKQNIYFATEMNRTFVERFIENTGPNGGTDHMPALKMALALKPEVIFFLTDAAEPRLSPADLDEIRRRNGGRTRIHAVEFGIGSPLSTDNFLKQLARQNNGSYRYRDVTKFER